jgi:hypothetical protein
VPINENSAVFWEIGQKIADALRPPHRGEIEAINADLAEKEIHRMLPRKVDLRRRDLAALTEDGEV